MATHLAWILYKRLFLTTRHSAEKVMWVTLLQIAGFTVVACMSQPSPLPAAGLTCSRPQLRHTALPFCTAHLVLLLCRTLGADLFSL